MNRTLEQRVKVKMQKLRGRGVGALGK